MSLTQAGCGKDVYREAEMLVAAEERVLSDPEKAKLGAVSPAEGARDDA